MQLGARRASRHRRSPHRHCFHPPCTHGIGGVSVYQPQWQGWTPNPPSSLPDLPDKSPLVRRVVLLAVPDGVPEEWVQGVADLMVMPPHPAWKDGDWHILQEDALRFLQKWPGQARRLGWEALDLFGVHPTAPTARFDCMGLVPLLKGRPMLALTDDSAAIKAASSGTLTFRRRAAPPVEWCLVWELAAPEMEIA